MRKKWYLYGMNTELLTYNLGAGVEAFSTRRYSDLPYPVIQGHQIHEARVAFIDRPGMTREELEGYDVYVTTLKGVAIGVRTADCVPVLLYDPVKKVVAAVHAGWKGTVLHISEKTVEMMIIKYGFHVEDIRALLGPSSGPDSFQVGPEVVERFRNAGFPMDQVWSWRGPGDVRVAGVRAGADEDLLDLFLFDLTERLHVVRQMRAGHERLELGHVEFDDLVVLRVLVGQKLRVILRSSLRG